VTPPVYTSPTTGNSFLLNLTHQDQEGAEQTCRDRGGHLAVYASSIEQREVEQFYIQNVSAALRCAPTPRAPAGGAAATARRRTG
jgi:hypothetical protein